MQGFDHIGHHAGARDDDKRNVTGFLTHLGEHGQPIHHRHAQITENQIGGVGAENLQALLAVSRLQCFKTTTLQIGGNTASDDIVIIDDQDRTAGH